MYDSKTVKTEALFSLAKSRIFCTAFAVKVERQTTLTCPHLILSLPPVVFDATGDPAAGAPAAAAGGGAAAGTGAAAERGTATDTRVAIGIEIGRGTEGGTRTRVKTRQTRRGE